MKKLGTSFNHLFTVLIAIVTTTIWLVGCYKGVSNSETIQVLQTEFASPNQVAMLVKRSDKAALSGDTYFVFVGNHLYSVAELRRSLYRLDPVMVAGRDGISLHWSRPNELVIECKMCGITQNMFEKQQTARGNVKIVYVGFS